MGEGGGPLGTGEIGARSSAFLRAKVHQQSRGMVILVLKKAKKLTNLQWRPEEVVVFSAKMRAAIKNNRLLAHHWL